MSGFKDFLHSSDGPKEKHRTINIKSSTHEFYKRTANFYGIGITTLVNNVLDDWLRKHGADISQDIKDKI